MNSIGVPGIDNPICNSCGLYVNKQTPFHGLEGNPHPDVLVIGEAVCCDGDTTGSVLKGASGRMIKDLLAEQGYWDMSAFLNVVRCHPEGNKLRKPVVDACSQFLLRDLWALKPVLTILSGKTAFQVVVGVKEKDWNGYTWLVDKGDGLFLSCYACYHPAYIMRRRSLEAEWRNGIISALDDVPTFQAFRIKGWDVSPGTFVR